LSKDGNSFETLNEPYVAHGATTTNALLPTQTYTVTLNDDEVYMMGDNRQFSSDSRVWGALKKKYIIGRAAVRILPLTRLDWLPGEYSFPE
jgi:signal peptidase I